ncbi:hypothetical protein [Vibrio sp. D431a]|uniref:hypothetical protein n=1 Tax=Vibrio sp. D431a TaxID=2837388 RepID=UPI0025568C57|nr:hypothetical protein [Vibrio sp. D431a]MDK9789826.1 hypothetical protein [Vibrio sp. D431a]
MFIKKLFASLFVVLILAGCCGKKAHETVRLEEQSTLSVLYIDELNQNGLHEIAPNYLLVGYSKETTFEKVDEFIDFQTQTVENSGVDPEFMFEAGLLPQTYKL